MALLDRFRSQPLSKHPDPAVRLAYVEELPIDERAELAAVAREDDDPRVRRAAVAKLMDPPALTTVAREDRDAAVRDQAVEMLRDIALEAFEGVEEGESLAAVDALEALGAASGAKTLALVAKSSTREAVARAALARVHDARTLGSIARHAAVESVRAAALESVSEHDEVLAVAMNSDFRDTALAALDRLPDRGDLETIAAGAKNKSAAKRARAILREQDERPAAEAAAAAPPPPDPDEIARVERQRAAAAEAAAAARAAEEARAQAEAAERRRADEEAARRREEREAAERARHVAQDEAAQKEAARRDARLAELADEADRASADADLAAARRRIAVARREWTDLIAGITIDPEPAAKFAAAETRLTAREAEAREADARHRREGLARLQQLVNRVEPLAARADLSLKAGERALHDIRAALGTMPPLPTKRDHEEIVRRLKAAHTALTPKVQELREADEWKRFANLSVQEQLCAKMEALDKAAAASVEGAAARPVDPDQIVRQIRDLQAQWRAAADVPRGQGDALWRRFKAAHDQLWARCEAYFAAQAEARVGNLARKIALCERAEALAGSTSWIKTAEEIKGLQAEWKRIGAVTRGQEKAIWERFRAACDTFFTRRHDDLVQRKALWAENLAKKDALCAKAEALAASTDWEAAAAEIKRLQAEWKTIGPVKKTRAEAIWQRFRTACDAFFTRYASRHDVARAERIAAREAIVAELEALAGGQPADAAQTDASLPDQPPADVLAKVRDLRRRWQLEIAARGVDRERALALEDRFQTAFRAVAERWPTVFAGTDLDPDANRKRMEALVKRIEELAGSLSRGVSPASDEALSASTRLAAMLKEALAANTIGGKVDEDSRWRAAQDEVRQAQANWSRIGPVPEPVRRALADRFQRACRTIAEKGARPGGPGVPGRSGREAR